MIFLPRLTRNWQGEKRQNIGTQLPKPKMKHHLRPILSLLSVISVLFVFGTGFATAQNVHVKKTPTFIDNGVTLSSNLCLSGLGNCDLSVTLTVDNAGVLATCTNQGGNQAPGQNPANVTVAGVTTVPKDAIKNGNVCVPVTTQAPANPTPDEAGCPNGNWSAAITDVIFSGKIATFTVKQATPCDTAPHVFTFTIPTLFNP